MNNMKRAYMKPAIEIVEIKEKDSMLNESYVAGGYIQDVVEGEGGYSSLTDNIWDR